jgi:hypothetical protein
VLRELPRQVPQAARFYQQRYGVENDPVAFTELAPRCPVFRIGPHRWVDPPRLSNGPPTRTGAVVTLSKTMTLPYGGRIVRTTY